MPLASYADEGTFKLYMLDIGLFGAKSELDTGTLPVPNNELFGMYNGAMAEQFVMQELRQPVLHPPSLLYLLLFIF